MGGYAVLLASAVPAELAPFLVGPNTLRRDRFGPAGHQAPQILHAPIPADGAGGSAMG